MALGSESGEPLAKPWASGWVAGPARLTEPATGWAGPAGWGVGQRGAGGAGGAAGEAMGGETWRASGWALPWAGAWVMALGSESGEPLAKPWASGWVSGPARLTEPATGWPGPLSWVLEQQATARSAWRTDEA